MTNHPTLRAARPGRMFWSHDGQGSTGKGIPPEAGAERSQAISGGLEIRAPAEWAALQSARADHRGAVLCEGDDRFISDAPKERSAAAELCPDCPILATCGAYALAGKERFGVWAGEDMKTPAGRRRLALSIETKETAA